MGTFLLFIGIFVPFLILVIGLHIREERKNNRAPILTVRAEVASKHVSGGDVTYWYVEFILDDDELTFRVQSEDYESVEIGDIVDLIYQGNRYLGCEHVFPLCDAYKFVASKRMTCEPFRDVDYDERYYVTFEGWGGLERMELRTGRGLHKKLDEGDYGLLTYRGAALHGFKLVAKRSFSPRGKHDEE